MSITIRNFLKIKQQITDNCVIVTWAIVMNKNNLDQYNRNVNKSKISNIPPKEIMNINKNSKNLTKNSSRPLLTLSVIMISARIVMKLLCIHPPSKY